MNKSYKEILISEHTDEDIFDVFVKIFIKEFEALLVHQVKNQDVRYFDFLINEKEITLHMETFVGITLFPTKLEKADEETQKTVDIIGLNLKLIYIKHLTGDVFHQPKKEKP